VARTSPGRRNDDKVPAAAEADPAELTEVDADEVSEDDDDGAVSIDRSLWERTNVEPVEIALPAGVGYTLRAYRPDNALTPTDISDRDDEDLFADRVRPGEEDEDEVIILDEDFPGDDEDDEDKDRAKARGRRAKAGDADDEDEDHEEDEDDEALAEEPEPEEVPVFLSHRGKLLLFRTPEGLVSYVRSGGPHDLAQLDTWAEVAEGIQPELVVATDDDSYELDLVVENLRGGHDAWDTSLLIDAGEISRDVAYALRLVPVLDALSPGSPLDDMDEALRSTAGGGLGGFRGRRRLKKIGAQTATLGWRTIIGKISAAVDWRD
jgi:hypothetical protein